MDVICVVVTGLPGLLETTVKLAYPETMAQRVLRARMERRVLTGPTVLRAPKVRLGIDTNLASA